MIVLFMWWLVAYSNPWVSASLACPGQVINLSSGDRWDQLRSCVVFDGTLHIVQLNESCCSSTACSFGNLFEITGSLVVEHSSCMSDLSILFPNLTVIRGQTHLSVGQVVPHQEFESIPVLLIRHTKLRAVGLLHLRFSGSRLALIDNPRMCHTELANWQSASGSRTEDTGFVNRDFSRVAFGLLQFCSNISALTPIPESHCDASCNRRRLACAMNDRTQCCDVQCLGSCFGPGPERCVACNTVRLGDRCLNLCPTGYYALHEHECVTLQECLRKETVSENGTKLFYSVLNDTCLRACPTGYVRDSTGHCTACLGSDCSLRACGHIQIQTVKDLQLIRHCFSARSLLISLQHCDNGRATERALRDAFANLEEIYGSLHIVSSNVLSTLSFMTSLRVIHGLRSDRPDSFGTSLEVAWNGELRHLWGYNSWTKKPLVPVTISSGRLVFTLNRNLCPAEIHRFIRSHLRLSRSLTILEQNLIDRSNGDVALCSIRQLDLTNVSAGQRSVHVSFVTLNWDDPREVLPPTLHFRIFDQLVRHHFDSICSDGTRENLVSLGRI